MNRIDRLTALLVHLQSKSRVPIYELEDRFEVSRRTIFRDIKSLMEAGVPIGGDAGEGYFVVEGYHLPPVMFNKEEAAALLLGAKLIEQHADGTTSQRVEDAMRKVRAVLKYTDRDFLETLENKIEIVKPLPTRNDNTQDLYISDIQTALVTRRVMEIEYYSNHSDSTSKRKVEPMALVHYSNRWHLIGYCQMRQAMRDFRTDRIQKLRITSEVYNPGSHPDFVHFAQNMTGGTDAREATIFFARKIVRFISDQKYYYGFIEEKEVEGGVEMKFLVPSYHFLAHWVLSFSSHATIISPSELQGITAKYASDVFEHHKKYFTAENPVT